LANDLPVRLMSITFACESCGKSFTVDDKFAGKKGKCKQCGAVMAIPEATAARAASRPVEREIAPSRRPAAPAPPPTEDVYGFDDAPTTANRGLPAGIEEVEPGAAVPSRFRPRSASPYDPPRSQKKGSGKGIGVGTVVLIAVGIVVGLGVLGGVGTVLMGMAGLSSKGDLESILQERVRLNEELAAVLSKVVDVDSARESSLMANQKFRAISANLRKLKATKGLQIDIDALKEKYAGAQVQATQLVVVQINRIDALPDEVAEALAVKDAVEELGREEAGIPGNAPSPAPPRQPVLAPPQAPPRLGPQPGVNPGVPKGPNRPNNRAKQGSRKGANRPNPGAPGAP
jgi:hypothetical protein